ncbi:hypothetical protein [Pseudomonas sp. W2-17]|uniref:hypothetical protein n=1 Tax=Pseudomonas sp. W2-17 TaxID=3058039 RepID=UPI0034E0594F
MTRGDVALLALIGTGLFVAGAVWRPVFGDYAKLKDALECTSFVATALAAMVAIYTLNLWKTQFRHAESFKALKELKDAATSLHAFRGYLLAVQARCMFLMQYGREQSEAIHEDEEAARQRWLTALQAYNRAWSTAVVFLTPEEEAAFRGPAPIFTRRSIDDPLKIVMAYANAPGVENVHQFAATARLITDEARHLYADTVSQLEWMLREKYQVASSK